jgi:hypothetical protein
VTRSRKKELRGWRLRTTFGPRKQRAERWNRLVREYGKRAALALSRTKLDYAELDEAMRPFLEATAAGHEAMPVYSGFDLGGGRDRTVRFVIDDENEFFGWLDDDKAGVSTPLTWSTSTSLEWKFDEFAAEITERVRAEFQKKVDDAIVRACNAGYPERPSTHWSPPVLGLRSRYLDHFLTSVTA